MIAEAHESAVAREALLSELQSRCQRLERELAAKDEVNQDRIAQLQSAFEQQTSALRRCSHEAAAAQLPAFATCVASALCAACAARDGGQPSAEDAASASVRCELDGPLQQLARAHMLDQPDAAEINEAARAVMQVLDTRRGDDAASAVADAEAARLREALQAAECALAAERSAWAAEKRELHGKLAAATADAERSRHAADAAAATAPATDMVRNNTPCINFETGTAVAQQWCVTSMGQDTAHLTLQV